MSKFYNSLIFLFIIFFSSASLAIVNVEPLRIRLEDKERALGSGKFYSSAEGGNKEKLYYGFGIFIGGRYDKHIHFISASGEFEKYNNIETTRNGFIHVRYNYKFHDTMYWEIFNQAEDDRFRLLKLRYLAGCGFRWKLADYLFYGTSYLVEYNKTEESEDIWERWNFYISLSKDIISGVTYNLVTYLQPRIDEDRFRFLGETGFIFKINKYLASEISFNINRDDEVPAGVGKVDWDLVNSLSFTF